MVNFKHIILKPVYDSDDDIVDFYSKVLSRTKIYDRVSAYVETGFFKLISKGVYGLIKSGGHMNLIVSTEISNLALERLTDTNNTFVEKEIDRILEELEEKDPRIADVNFLISIKKLNVKIAILNNTGFVHEKYGVLEDFDGNILSMSGSNNDTVASIKSNFESFEITKTWDDSLFSLEKVNLRKSKFDKLWNNEKDNIIVIDIKNYLRNKSEKSVKEIPGNVGLNIAFLDTIDNQVYLKTNFNFEKVLELNNFIDFKEFIIRKSTNNFDVNLTDYDDLGNFIALIKSFEKELNFKVLLSSYLEEIISSMVLDMKTISNNGYFLKDNEYNSSKDFSKRMNNLNRLLLRPLREAQALASLHFVDTKRAMNFSVPGSGKTAMIIGSFLQLRLDNKVDKMLVLGPKSIFKSWKDEYQTLLGENGKSKVLSLVGEISKSSKKFTIDVDYNKVDIIIVNYESIESLATVLEKRINHRTLIVFDEIHRLKKFQGKRYLIANQISKKTAYRVALTGTPLPNGYQDLHNMFEILFGNYSKSYFKFYKENLTKENNNYKLTKQENEKLNELIYPFFVRITKKDLNIKPPNEDIIKRIKLKSNEKTKFDSLKNSNINFLSKIAKLSNFTFSIEEQSKEDLGRTINELKGEEEIIESTLMNNSSKMKEGLLLVQELLEANKKVLVWTVYLSTMFTFEKLLKNNGINVRIIYGSTDSDERNEIIDDFNYRSLDVLITNPQTLSESVSLHHSCHDAIYLEQPLNLSQYLQSRDRIHRLGIDESQETNYYFLFNYSENYSLDNRIYDLLKFKEEQMYKAIKDNSLLVDESFDENELKSLL
jgi:SNF2 family DNA or RNA helicase